MPLPQNSVADPHPDPHGSASILVGWIRIRIPIGNTDCRIAIFNQKNINFISAVNFSNFWSSKPWIWIRIHIRIRIETNADPQHCYILNWIRLGIPWNAVSWNAQVKKSESPSWVCVWIMFRARSFATIHKPQIMIRIMKKSIRVIPLKKSTGSRSGSEIGKFHFGSRFKKKVPDPLGSGMNNYNKTIKLPELLLWPWASPVQCWAGRPAPQWYGPLSATPGTGDGPSVEGSDTR